MKRKVNVAERSAPRKANMSPLGIFVWTCITEHTSRLGMFHPATEFPPMVCMGERTLRRRLENNNWEEEELFRIAKITRSQKLIDYMVSRYKNINEILF